MAARGGRECRTGGETEVFTNDNFYDKFNNLSPQQIPDFKGIAGDSSDNLKGISGIGEKGAIDLLKKFDSIEDIIENSWQLSESLQKKIQNGKDEGLLSKKLARIIVEGDFEIDFDCFTPKEMNYENLNNFLKSKNLFNVIKKIERKS